MRTIMLTCMLLSLAACSSSSSSTSTCNNSTPFGALTGSCEGDAATDATGVTDANHLEDVQNDTQFDAGTPGDSAVPLDAQPHDASTWDAPTTCTPKAAALAGNCPYGVFGGYINVNVPANYCLVTPPPNGGTAKTTPAECKCIETFNCACLEAHSTNGGCGPGNPATCDETTGVPIVTCAH